MTAGSERLVWVSLPHATFGLVILDGRIVDAPPIARWTIGRDERSIAAWLRRRGAIFRDAPARARIRA